MASPKTNLFGEIWDYLKTGWKYFRTKKAEPVLKDILIFFKKKTVKISFWILILLSLIPVGLFIAAIVTGFNSYDGWLVKKYFFWSYVSLIIPMTFVGIIFGIILKTVSVATKFFSALEGVVDLYYNPEHAAKTFRKFFLVLWWLTVASFVCYLVPVYNNSFLFGIVVLATIFFIVSTLAGVITPSPKIYQQIWQMVLVAFLVAIVLLFLGPSGYRKAARTNEKGVATEKYFRDKFLEKKISLVNEKMEKAGEAGNEKSFNYWADSLHVLQAELKAKRKSGVSLDSIKETGDSLLGKIRGKSGQNSSAKNGANNQPAPIVSQYSSDGHLWEIDPALKPDNMTWLSPTEFELELQPAEVCSTNVVRPVGGNWNIINPSGNKFAFKSYDVWREETKTYIPLNTTIKGLLVFRGGDVPIKLKIQLGV